MCVIRAALSGGCESEKEDACGRRIQFQFEALSQTAKQTTPKKADVYERRSRAVRQGWRERDAQPIFHHATHE